MRAAVRWPGRDTLRFGLWVVALYTVFRLVTTGILLWVIEAEQDPRIYSGERPRYFDFATLWDGAWYRRIAEEGYPDHIPVGPTGEVRQNPWAFYPMFPMLARGLTAVSGWSFEITGTLVAVLLGYAAALVIAVLLRQQVGAAAALAGVAVVAAFPTAPTLQVAYTESLAMLLLATVLLLLSRRRWGAAGIVAVLTGLARPIALPLGLVALVAVVLRWRRRAEDPLGRGELWRMLWALAGCGISGLLWPAIVWRSTGQADGYTRTMSAWRGGETVLPFLPTIEAVQVLFGEFRGPLLLLLAAGLLALAVLGPWASGLGPEMRTWSLAYPFYLVAALSPWTSIYRYLLPLFPVFVVMVGGGWPRGHGKASPTWLLVTRTVIICLLCVGWQLWWSWELFRFEPPSDNPP